MALTESQARNRVGRIGSSDVPQILGLSPYGNKSPAKQRRDAYFSILGLNKKPESSSMRDGNFIEPAVLNWVEHKLGHPFERDTQLVHPEYDWAVASFDGKGRAESGGFVVEVKWVENPMYQDHWGRAGTKNPDQIPPYVLSQVMHQLFVAGPEYQVAYVGVLRAKNGFGLYTIPKDDELIGIIFERLEKFYTDHILPRRAPELPANEQEGSAA